MWLYVWLAFVFAVGICVGSFLNVAVARLPLNLSVFWPPSRCGKCLAPVRWYDNLPLVSYWWLGGRCRACGDAFSMRYFLIELMTGFGFLLLFWLEVVVNIHGWRDNEQGWGIQHGFYPWQWWLGFLYHALLFSLLLIAAMCDIECRRVPLRLSALGTVLGLAGATLLPWLCVLDEARAATSVHGVNFVSWPIWGSPTDCLSRGDGWEIGIGRGLAGMMPGAGYLLICFFSQHSDTTNGGRLEYAALLMVAGSFLGLKVTVAAILMHVLFSASSRVLQRYVRPGNSFPPGASLAVSALLSNVACSGLPNV